MSTTEYKQRHPLAWALIAGVALFSVASVGAIQGWLPGIERLGRAPACADCAVVESVSGDVYDYEVVVRYEDGSTGVFSQVDPPQWQVGDKVRVVDGMELVAG